MFNSYVKLPEGILSNIYIQYLGDDHNQRLFISLLIGGVYVGNPVGVSITTMKDL